VNLQSWSFANIVFVAAVLNLDDDAGFEQLKSGLLVMLNNFQAGAHHFKLMGEDIAYQYCFYAAFWGQVP
jgi:hypothetical protein